MLSYDSYLTTKTINGQACCTVQGYTYADKPTAAQWRSWSTETAQRIECQRAIGASMGGPQYTLYQIEEEYHGHH